MISFFPNNNGINKKTSIIRIAILSLLLFGFIYEVQPIGIPDLLTSRKIVFYISGAIYYYLTFSKTKIAHVNMESRVAVKNCMIVLRLAIILLVYVSIIYFISTALGSYGRSALSFAVLFFVYAPFMPLFYSKLFKTTKEFAVALIVATLLQCIVVFADFFSANVRVFLFEHFVLDTNYSYLTTARASGLGAGESLLSINLFLGLIGCGYMLLQGKYTLLFVLCYGIITFAVFLSGSIGLTFSLLLLITIIIYLLYKKKVFRITKIILLVIVLIGLIITIIPEFFNDIENFEIYKKFIDFLYNRNESSFISSLSRQQIAPIDIDTILGTGYHAGESWMGNTTRADSGYIKSYFGFGLPMAIIFYLVFYISTFKTIKKINDLPTKVITFFFLATIIIAEIKEPYIFHFGEPILILTIVYISLNQQCRMELMNKQDIKQIKEINKCEE